jgi:hypothetical protein
MDVKLVGGTRPCGDLLHQPGFERHHLLVPALRQSAGTPVGLERADLDRGAAPPALRRSLARAAPAPAQSWPSARATAARAPRGWAAADEPTPEDLSALFLVEGTDGNNQLKPFASPKVFAETNLERDLESWVKNSMLNEYRSPSSANRSGRRACNGL